MSTHRPRTVSPGSVVFLFVVGELVACASATSPAGERTAAGADVTVRVFEPKEPALPEMSWGPPLTPPAPDPMFACSETEDCVVIQLGCCDHCNGGSLLATTVSAMDEAYARFAETGCDETTCTERGCAIDYRPVCDRGTCARLEQIDLGEAGMQVTLVHNEGTPHAPVLLRP